MFPPDPNEPQWMTWLRNRTVRRNIILGLLWIFIAVVIVSFRGVLLPFALAGLLAFVIEPFVQAMECRTVRGKPIPRIAAVLLLYLVVAVCVGTFARWTLPAIGGEIAKAGSEATAFFGQTETIALRAIDRAEQLSLRFGLPVDRAGLEAFATDNLATLAAEAQKNVTNLLHVGRSIVGYAFHSVFGLFLVLMLTAFLSMDRRKIELFFASLVPDQLVRNYHQIMNAGAIGLAGVVRGQVTICLLNGLLTFIGLWLFDVNFPFLLAAIAAVFSLIPIFGSILSTIPIVGMALTDGFGLGAIILLWIIGIHLLEANFLNPKIMGDAAKIHPVVVVFVLIAGEQASGLIGALFAVPITSIVVTLFKFLRGRALGEGSPSVPVVSEDPQVPEA